MSNRPLTHIVGTFLIQAEGAFLNGSTKDTIDGYDATTPKLLQEFKNKIPYVSAQAWRHWLRETFKEEYPSEPTTPIETTKSGEGEGKDKAKLTTTKVGVKIDPILYAEHDIFGYMNVKEGQGKGDVKPTIRSSPFQSSILLSVRKSGWEGIDKGFVYPKSVALSFYHEELDNLLKTESKLKDGQKKMVADLKKVVDSDISREDLVTQLEKGLMNIAKAGDGESDLLKSVIRKVTLTVSSPLPYTSRFYNTHLQGIFGLAYHRLGLFRIAGDREELESAMIERHLGKRLEEVPSDEKAVKIYQIRDQDGKNTRKERTEKILRSLARLRGGAKQAQFGTDVSPKVIIIAGLSCGNLIFNDLFEDTKELVTNPREQSNDGSVQVVESQVIGGVRLKLDMFKQIIWDYRDRLKTPVYIGLRSGYLSKSSENELNSWINSNERWMMMPLGATIDISKENNLPEVQLCSPIEAVERLLAKLEPNQENKK